MSVLNKLASAQNRNDEVPNQILAKELADSGDKAAVKELVDNLSNRDKNIQSDCIKVLYEIGALKPELIAAYVDNFIALLRGRNNRLVWGAMTALGAIATLKAADIWRQIDIVMRSTELGSAITQDWGIRVLAAVSAADPAHEKKILPLLKTFLQNCRPKDLPRHAESVLPAINTTNRQEIATVLEARVASLRPPQAKRLEKVLRAIKAL